MKLGISYNVFDGLELLRPSILSVRECADYIAVVYQNVSNHFINSDKDIKGILENLKKDNLIDCIVLYQPNLKTYSLNSNIPVFDLHRNEISKRQIGLECCKAAGCTHHLSMDVDEFYFSNELKMAKKKIDQEGYDATAANIQEYYSKPIYRKIGLSDYYVSFIHKVDLSLKQDGDYFVLVDPTRRVCGYANSYLFNPDEITMHHFSTIRSSKKNLETKYINSSARSILKNIPQVLAKEAWEFIPDETIEIVDDYFNISKEILLG